MLGRCGGKALGGSGRCREIISSVVINWCTDRAAIAELARFFIDNTEPDYISHGEMQEGRALDADHWAPSLEQALIEEMEAALDARPADSRRRWFLSARDDNEIVAFGMVLFEAEALVPYAVIEDLVVRSSERNRGIGSQVLAWIEQEAKQRGCQRIFLESGIRNERAHSFFERAGFRVCSTVMTKPV